MQNDKKHPEDFTSLVLKRRSFGFEEFAIEVDGSKVDRALYIDTSWEALEEMSDGYIYLSFEMEKLRALGLKLEARRIEALRRTIWRVGRDLYTYRKRISISAPNLLENKLSEVLDVVRPSSSDQV